MSNTESFNEITGSIIGAAIQVHRALGPGLLESAYEACLAYELGLQGIKVELQKPVPIVYHEVKLVLGQIDSDKPIYVGHRPLPP